jgi:glutamyl-tRNA synthetase
MAETPAQRAQFEAQGRKGVVRLKMPRTGACRFDDHIRGAMKIDWASEQDHVIQRADGTCLYHLASVVDDYDMKITHVIRAEEHLSNTPRQIFIAQGLGYPLPEYAHLPFVAEPGSRNKLSKRKIAQYHEQVGYLPHAILNYLLLLGWSLDDKTEFFTPEAMIDSFSLERVNKAPASFDPQKLFAFQEHYMLQTPADAKVAMTLPYLQKMGLVTDATHDAKATLRQVIEAAGDRIKVAGDAVNFGDFFTADEQLPFDEKQFDKRVRNAPESVALLRKFQGELANATAFDAAALEKLLNTFLEREQAQIGQIIHALRLTLTGKAVGFGMFETMAILGKEKCLARIKRGLQRLA